MENFRVGDLVGVPCVIDIGAFPDERLVTLETTDGNISGFIQSRFVLKKEGINGLVQGRILEVTDDNVTIQLPGSFFTTATGKASVSTSWAQSNFQPAFAA